MEYWNGDNIDWNDYPSKQIDMIMDVMDIPVSEIIDWYLDNIKWTSKIKI